LSLRPLHKFRVHPEHGRGLYFDVYLWRTLRELRHYAERVWRVDHPERRHAWAWTFLEEYRSTATGRRLPYVGEMHFAKGRCPVEMVTHEVSHAALGWAARKRLVVAESDTIGSHDEERLCYAQGRMNQLIVDELKRRGYWQD
jgi:hypothetical protein